MGTWDPMQFGLHYHVHETSHNSLLYFQDFNACLQGFYLFQSHSFFIFYKMICFLSIKKIAG